jgi:hypothetical protein
MNISMKYFTLLVAGKTRFHAQAKTVVGQAVLQVPDESVGVHPFSN